MNERIEELAKQAFEHAYDNGGIRISTVIPASYTEKFAELIILECANVIVTDPRLSDVRSATHGCARSIKEHFGVEE